MVEPLQHDGLLLLPWSGFPVSTVMDFLQHHATLVLFLCICLGYLIGNISIGRFRLGGVCGTLLVALVLGQAQVQVAPGASQVAFALFIFSLGYLAGPQFVASFSRRDVRLLLFPVIEVLVVTALVLGASVAFRLGPGTAAGLFAGGTSQSAAVGTATEALAHSGLAAGAVAAEQADLAAAYSLCYLCGLLTIVVFSSQLAPALMRVDLAADAAAVLRTLLQAGAQRPLESSSDLVGRVYRAGADAPPDVSALEERLGVGVLVAAVLRDGNVLPRRGDLGLQAADLVQVVGRRAGLAATPTVLAEEVSTPPSLDRTSQTADVMVTRRALQSRGATLQDLLARHDDVVVTEIQRGGRVLPALATLELRPGDVVTMFGPAEGIQRAGEAFGQTIDPTIRADFAYLGAGLVVGMIVGLLDLKWGPLDMTVGTGGGVLLSGLLFGWLRTRRSTIGAYAPVAAEVIKDLGLTIFIAVTGLTAAPQVVAMMKEVGAALPVTAVLLTLVPASISLVVARRVLDMPSPLALGAVVGQQCSSPALTALQERTGNTVPSISYVKVYAMCNVMLPLLGPVIVGIVTALNG